MGADPAGLPANSETRVDAELGEQGADVDWTSLDPRRYDPRRIVREALFDNLPAPEPRPRRTDLPATGSVPLEPDAGETAA